MPFTQLLWPGGSCGQFIGPFAPHISVPNILHLKKNFAVTIIFFRFLATGEIYESLSFAFRISPSYISRIIRKVLQLCSDKLPSIFMPATTPQDFLAMSKEFELKWNFPNCISAVDGKHVRIFCPRNRVSQFFNYKDFFPWCCSLLWMLTTSL